jgi:hypothetical protein
MPGHVYIRTGDFEAAVKTNQLAASADRAYIQANGAGGIYPAMYYSHNLHFIAACSSMNGNYAEAHKAAEMLATHVGPLVKDIPPLEGFDGAPCGGSPLPKVGPNTGNAATACRHRPLLFLAFARHGAWQRKGKVAEARPSTTS